MNPLRWQREHQVAGLVICLLGAVLGLFLAVILASLQNALVIGASLLAVLRYPQLYWPYPTFGLLIAGLAFYAWRLLRI